MLMRIGMFDANVLRKDRINHIIVDLDAYTSRHFSKSTIVDKVHFTICKTFTPIRYVL